MKIPHHDGAPSLRGKNKYRPRRHEQKAHITRKRSLGTIVIMVDGDWKTFRRYQPQWDKRLYHYMSRYFDNKGTP